MAAQRLTRAQSASEINPHADGTGPDTSPTAPSGEVSSATAFRLPYSRGLFGSRPQTPTATPPTSSFTKIPPPVAPPPPILPPGPHANATPGPTVATPPQIDAQHVVANAAEPAAQNSASTAKAKSKGKAPVKVPTPTTPVPGSSVVPGSTASFLLRLGIDDLVDNSKKKTVAELSDAVARLSTAVAESTASSDRSLRDLEETVVAHTSQIAGVVLEQGANFTVTQENQQNLYDHVVSNNDTLTARLNTVHNDLSATTAASTQMGQALAMTENSVVQVSAQVAELRDVVVRQTGIIEQQGEMIRLLHPSAASLPPFAGPTAAPLSYSLPALGVQEIIQPSLSISAPGSQLAWRAPRVNAESFPVMQAPAFAPVGPPPPPFIAPPPVGFPAMSRVAPPPPVAGANHPNTARRPPKAPPAAPAAKRVKGLIPKQGETVVTTTGITYGSDISGEAQATIRRVLRDLADPVVGLNSFRAFRGAPVMGMPTLQFLAPSVEWAAWFCESWNAEVVKSPWPDSRATYETCHSLN
ncbi:hypothetical protein BDZ89DRAFT_478446 [Hymenopellis radicata]|nr:hypothetical protein BDZ89DRAFT_478446 [Hymenopellis radicata]